MALNNVQALSITILPRNSVRCCLYVPLSVLITIYMKKQLVFIQSQFPLVLQLAWQQPVEPVLSYLKSREGPHIRTSSRGLRFA